MKHRLLFPAAVAAILVGLLLMGLDPLLDWRAGKAFERVQKGDAESRVIMFLGTPTRTTGCGEWLWWGEAGQGKNEGQCVRSARYDYRHSSWVVGYSADGHVVSKYHEAAAAGQAR